MPQRTPEGKWVLYDKATGQRFERWPVDAREMLATGSYTADPLNGDQPAATVGGDRDASTEGGAPPATLFEGEPVIPAAPASQQQHPLGGAIVATPPGTAAPAEPVQLPTGRANAGRRR